MVPSVLHEEVTAEAKEFRRGNYGLHSSRSRGQEKNARQAIAGAVPLRLAIAKTGWLRDRMLRIKKGGNLLFHMLK